VRQLRRQGPGWTDREFVNTELHYLELLELAARLRRREVSSVEATRAQLERIARLDPHLASYALVTADEALASAAAADAEIAAGRYRGPLHGVPLGVKDLFYTKGIRTSGGMAVYRDFIPAEDATAVSRLRQAGAVILGKLQMTEGAYSDHHPSVIPPKNPWNPEYWTGISSSGSATATAAGLCYGSLASDTGGSIRWPCAANGLTGIKSTWGRVSRYGTFELAPSLDHIGTIARSAADAAELLGVIAGHDHRDPTTLLDPAPDFLLQGGIRRLRIGIDARWNCDDVDESVCKMLSVAADVFRGLGATVVDVTVPDVRQSIVDWSTVCAVEAALVHEANYPRRKDEYGLVLASVLDAGRAVAGIELQRILHRRMELSGRFAELFTTVDILLAPAQPFAPLTLNAIRTLGEQPELILKLQRFTAPFDMTGNPTISLPGGFTEAGLPVGFQLAAGNLNELQLVQAARAFQKVTGWHHRHPDLQATPTSVG
jgi:amidase